MEKVGNVDKKNYAWAVYNLCKLILYTLGASETFSHWKFQVFSFYIFFSKKNKQKNWTINFSNLETLWTKCAGASEVYTKFFWKIYYRASFKIIFGQKKSVETPVLALSVCLSYGLEGSRELRTLISWVLGWWAFKNAKAILPKKIFECLLWI